MKRVVKLKQNPDNIVTVEVLADEIANISRGIKALRASRLNESTLLLLIQHAAPKPKGTRGYAPIPLKTIKAVIDGIDGLQAACLKAKRS